MYKVIAGDADMFGVEMQSGEIRTLAAVAKSKKKYFNLTVVAEDMDNPELFSSINLKVFGPRLKKTCLRGV